MNRVDVGNTHGTKNYGDVFHLTKDSTKQKNSQNKNSKTKFCNKLPVKLLFLKRLTAKWFFSYKTVNRYKHSLARISMLVFGPVNGNVVFTLFLLIICKKLHYFFSNERAEVHFEN